MVDRPASTDRGMPLGYHISADQGLITVQGQGEVTLSELTRLGQSLLSDEDYDATLAQLLDFRGLRPVIEGHLDDLQAFVRGPYRDGVTASVAVVIDEHLEGCHGADIFLLTCAIAGAELFSNYDQALKWLMRQAFATVPVPLAQQENPYCDHADGAPE